MGHSLGHSKMAASYYWLQFFSPQASFYFEISALIRAIIARGGGEGGGSDGMRIWRLMEVGVG